MKAKCRSKRNDIAANIRDAMFAAFGEERLERIDNTTSPVKLAEWKNSEKTKKAYEELFSNHDLLQKLVIMFLSHIKKRSCQLCIVHTFFPFVTLY